MKKIKSAMCKIADYKPVRIAGIAVLAILLVAVFGVMLLGVYLAPP